jgi:hypothetical protein
MQRVTHPHSLRGTMVLTVLATLFTISNTGCKKSTDVPAATAQTQSEPQQKPRGRLWLNDGSCVRLRPEHSNHVWSYDFVITFTHDGRTVRVLNLIDEYTCECLAIHVRRRINSSNVIEVLADAISLFL